MPSPPDTLIAAAGSHWHWLCVTSCTIVYGKYVYHLEGFTIVTNHTHSEKLIAEWPRQANCERFAQHMHTSAKHATPPSCMCNYCFERGVRPGLNHRHCRMHISRKHGNARTGALSEHLMSGVLQLIAWIDYECGVREWRENDGHLVSFAQITRHCCEGSDGQIEWYTHAFWIEHNRYNTLDQYNSGNHRFPLIEIDVLQFGNAISGNPAFGINENRKTRIEHRSKCCAAKRIGTERKSHILDEILYIQKYPYSMLQAV